jgi:DNA-binding HxlR family transcriptional regulator
MREACLGTRRFEEFQRTVGTGRNILAERLNTLVDEGVLARPAHYDTRTEQGLAYDRTAWLQRARHPDVERRFH